jgi:hypothetical protein
MAAVLDFYGIQYRHVFGWQSILCPIVPETRPSCRISLDGGFKCMSCGAEGGDAIDLIRAREQLDFTEALDFCRRVPGEREAGAEPAPYSRRGSGAAATYRPNFQRRRR